MGKRKVTMIVLFLIAILLIVYIIWGNSALVVNEISIASNRLPEAFSGFRIAQISDLHNAEFGTDNTKLLQLLQEIDPDIIVITGDLIDSNHTDIAVALRFAEKASEIAPTYYVNGNHEALIDEYESLRDGLEAIGVTVLSDQSNTLERDGESIQLIGLNDLGFVPISGVENKIQVLSETLKALIDKDAPYKILLSHRPELFETYINCSVDLVFSGHAHGGQFRIPFIGGLIAPGQGLFPKYDAGLYTGGDTNMVVSRGLGNSIIPFRVNNRPEIVLVELSN